MSEEVTDTTLEFQDPVGAGNNRDGSNLRERSRSSERARCDLEERQVLSAWGAGFDTDPKATLCCGTSEMETKLWNTSAEWVFPILKEKMWQWYQNSCYYFATNEEKTWTNSRKNCTEKNSTLVKIDSSEEKDFLKSRPLSESSFFWLGLSWDPTGKSWLWDDGSIPSPSL